MDQIPPTEKVDGQERFARQWLELQEIYRELVRRPILRAKRWKVGVAVLVGILVACILVFAIAAGEGTASAAEKVGLFGAGYVVCCLAAGVIVTLVDQSGCHSLHARVMRYEPICEPAFHTHILGHAERGRLEDLFILVWLEEERKALFAAAGWPDLPKRR